VQAHMSKAMIRLSTLSLAVCLFCAASGVYSEEMRSEVRFSCRLLGPIDPTNTVLEVTYENVGAIPVGFARPGNMQKLYRGLTLIADGEQVPYLYSLPFDEDVHFRDQVLLTNRASCTFQLALSETWRLPKNWRTLEVQRTGVHAPGSRCGASVVSNAKESFIFDSEGRRLRDGVSDGTSVVPVAHRCQVSVAGTIESAVSGHAKTLALIFRNNADEPVYLDIPEQVSDYRGVELVIDGQTVPYRHKSPASYFTQVGTATTIGPGTEHVLRLKMEQVWPLPDHWETMEIRLTKFHRPTDARGLPCRIPNETERLFVMRNGEKSSLPDGKTL